MDKAGYFPFDERTANVFFLVISNLYEQAAMILTSSKSYLEWGKVFVDVLATYDFYNNDLLRLAWISSPFIDNQL